MVSFNAWLELHVVADVWADNWQTHCGQCNITERFTYIGFAGVCHELQSYLWSENNEGHSPKRILSASFATYLTAATPLPIYFMFATWIKNELSFLYNKLLCVIYF